MAIVMAVAATVAMRAKSFLEVIGELHPALDYSNSDLPIRYKSAPKEKRLLMHAKADEPVRVWPDLIHHQ